MELRIFKGRAPMAQLPTSAPTKSDWFKPTDVEGPAALDISYQQERMKICELLSRAALEYLSTQVNYCQRFPSGDRKLFQKSTMAHPPDYDLIS